MAFQLYNIQIYKLVQTHNYISKIEDLAILSTLFFIYIAPSTVTSLFHSLGS